MALYELDGTASRAGDGQYWVAANATVLGRVILEEDVSVWFNAVIRGDNEPIRIGARRTCRTAASCTPILAFR